MLTITFGFVLGPLFFGLIGAALLEQRGYFRAYGAIAMIAVLATAGFLIATILFQTLSSIQMAAWAVDAYLYGGAVILSLLLAVTALLLAQPGLARRILFALAAASALGTIAIAGALTLLLQPLFLVVGLIYLGMAIANPPLRPGEAG